MSFTQALAFTLREEGGYVDDPADHGGATNRGVTQKTYDDYRRSRGLALRSVRGMDALETAAIYQHLFWEPAHCAELETHLAICHFDWAVNHGVTGAIRTLQSALGISADGIFGPGTRGAAESADADKALSQYLALRRAWYLERVKAEPDQARFLAGWLGRVDRLQAYLGTLP